MNFIYIPLQHTLVGRTKGPYLWTVWDHANWMEDSAITIGIVCGDSVEYYIFLSVSI